MINTENNPKNKILFFSQYMGQKVFVNPMLSQTPVNNIYLFDVDIDLQEDIDSEYLELKSLSKISDDDAILILEIINGKSISTYTPEDLIVAKEEVKELFSLFIEELDDRIKISSVIYAMDKLRELGYLINWNGLTPEQIIKYGWAKI